MGTPPEPLVYCLTRDHDLAAILDERLTGALVFFYNDAARLHQAIVLRVPNVVVIDTGAVRAEFGDAGLGPVVAFVRERAAEARIAVRPGPRRRVARGRGGRGGRRDAPGRRSRRAGRRSPPLPAESAHQPDPSGWPVPEEHPPAHR